MLLKACCVVIAVACGLFALHHIPLRPAAVALEKVTQASAEAKPRDVLPVAPGSENIIAMWDVEQDIVAYTNAKRIAARIAPLRIDNSCMLTARQHCVWMARTGRLRHGNLSSQGVSAENIAMGQSRAPEVVETWYNSAGHRTNMMSTGFTKIGVAGYAAQNGTVYWCQQFK